MLSRPDGFMSPDKMGLDFFSIYEFLYPNIKIRLRLFRARPIFYMINDKSNVSLGIVDCSFYTRCIAHKIDYHKKRMKAFLEFNYLETLARTFNIPPRQN